MAGVVDKDTGASVCHAGSSRGCAAGEGSVVSPEQFADFLGRTGHRVVRSASSYWYDASFCVFLSCPSQRLLSPSSDEVRLVMRNQPCVGLRFAGPETGPGKLSYQIVCEDRGYSIDRLSANTRSKVRRGLKRCEVGPISFEELEVHGRVADRDTLERQGRRASVAGKRWGRFWRAAASTPGIESWAARVGPDVAAFLVTVQFEDGVEFLMARSRTDYSNAYANNALIFRVAQEMLVGRGVREITFGLESLEPVASLDQFKLGMGFFRRPLRQRVEFHPLLRPLVCSATARGMFYRLARRPGPEGTFLRKTAGLLRFAEESRP